MRHQKEIKAGLIAVVAVALFVCLVNFLKGNSFFQTSTLLYAMYDDVGVLEPSRPVTVNGLKVGKVEKIYFHSNHSGRLVVEMRVETDLSFSVNTIAMINGAGLVSGPQISLILSHEGRRVKDGDMIKGMLKSSALSGLLSDVDPFKIKVQQIFTRMDNALASLNGVLNQENQAHIKVLFRGLNATLHSLKTGTDAIARTTYHFNRMADTATTVIADNHSSLNISLQSLGQMMDKISRGQGTLGKLISDDKLYNQLSQLSRELELLVQDLRLHPKRYFHFSIFGKKEQPYQESPLAK